MPHGLTDLFNPHLPGPKSSEGRLAWVLKPSLKLQQLRLACGARCVCTDVLSQKALRINKKKVLEQPNLPRQSRQDAEMGNTGSRFPHQPLEGITLCRRVHWSTFFCWWRILYTNGANTHPWENILPKSNEAAKVTAVVKSWLEQKQDQTLLLLVNGNFDLAEHNSFSNKILLSGESRGVFGSRRHHKVAINHRRQCPVGRRKSREECR